MKRNERSAESKGEGSARDPINLQPGVNHMEGGATEKKTLNHPADYHFVSQRLCLNSS